MPLFGKKGKDDKKGPPQGGPAYPTQQTSPYPTQQAPAYSSQSYGQPPPYTPQQQASAPQYPTSQPQAYYPAQPQYGYGAPPPHGYAQPYGQPYGVPYIPPGSHVVGHGQFDAGARFNSGAQMRVPPPPPGCAPNPAQVATMYGGTAMMSQGKAGFFTTSSDGGVTTHID